MNKTAENTRVLLAGAFALSALAVPVLSVLGGPAAAPAPLASCPAGEVLDPLSGSCMGVTEVTPSTLDPINPEGAALQPGSLTSSDLSNLGQLPEINGIPCNGDNTGLCIGLSEVNSLQAHTGLSGTG